MERGGRTLVTFWEDPEFKRLLAQAAKKEGRPLGTVIRGLLREWAKERNVKIPTDKMSKEGEANA
jgi:hypothetical protein